MIYKKNSYRQKQVKDNDRKLNVLLVLATKILDIEKERQEDGIRNAIDFLVNEGTVDNFKPCIRENNKNECHTCKIICSKNINPDL